MKLVAWLLRLNGLVLMVAFAAIFLPAATMQMVHKQLGLGELPQAAIVEYLTRSISALYAIHGALAFVISLHIQRCWPIVPWIAGLHVLFGSLMVWIDWQAELPWYWTATEGPSIILFALLLFTLWARAAPSATTDSFPENNSRVTID
jgi:hypothetical protein